MSGGDTEDDEQFWEEHKDHIYKIMVVGPSYVGKTQLVQCYVNRKRTLDPDYIPTKVLGFESDETSIDCVMKYIHVYDASGNRDDLIMVESYFSAMNAFVFVFDLSNEQSFQELKDFWVKKVQAKANVHTKYVLVGNKVDKKNARVEFEPAKEFAKSEDITYKEVCSTEWLTSKSVFYDLVVEMKDYFDHLPGGMPSHLRPGPNLPPADKTPGSESNSSVCVVL